MFGKLRLLSGASSPRGELIAIQKRIFSRNKKTIAESTLIDDPDLLAYQKNYLAALRVYQEEASLADLLEAMQTSDIVLVGDYHTNPQSQRAFLRLLRQLVSKEQKLVVALEFINRKKQIYLDQYLNGKISEAVFLQKIQLKKHFYFDLWNNFKPIFEYCLSKKIPMYGLETAPFGAGLKRRDEAMAQTLEAISTQNKAATLLCLVGDLHIAPKHLPREIGKVFPDKPKVLQVYQNSEQLYWDLAVAGKEDKVEIVKIKNQAYCLMNTPPVVWQQSYLNWLAHEEEFDYQDPKANFVDLMTLIAGFMGLKLPKNTDEVEVFTWNDLGFLDHLEKDNSINARQLAAIAMQIEASETLYFAQGKWVYLGNFSLNHAAAAASHCLKDLLCGEEKPASSWDAFYANLLYEAVGFFGSKLINHKRKCLRESDYQNYLNFEQQSEFVRNKNLSHNVARWVLTHQQKMRQGRDPLIMTEMLGNYKLFFGVSKALGHILGERLYYALIKNRLSKSELAKLFSKSHCGDVGAYLIYRQYYQKVHNMRIPARW